MAIHCTKHFFGPQREIFEDNSVLIYGRKELLWTLWNSSISYLQHTVSLYWHAYKWICMVQETVACVFYPACHFLLCSVRLFLSPTHNSLVAAVRQRLPSHIQLTGREAKDAGTSWPWVGQCKFFHRVLSSRFSHFAYKNWLFFSLETTTKNTGSRERQLLAKLKSVLKERVKATKEVNKAWMRRECDICCRVQRLTS